MNALRLPVILAATLALAACSSESDTQEATEPAAETPVEFSEPAYVGQWAADPVWCTDQSEGFPITIAAARFEGRENSCEMSRITETPEGGWTAHLTCHAEGQIVEEGIVFSPVGDQLAIIWPDRDVETTLFKRCD